MAQKPIHPRYDPSQPLLRDIVFVCAIPRECDSIQVHLTRVPGLAVR
jgi:hypothetical protein